MNKFLIKRPTSVLMSFIAFCLIGGYSYWQLPISLMPNIAVPEIEISVTNDFLSSDEIEEKVTTPLRESMLQIPFLEKIESKSHDQKAQIKLYLSHKVDLDQSYFLVNDRLDQIMNTLPSNSQRPLVQKMSTVSIPSLYVSVQSTSSKVNNQLSLFCKNTLRRRFEQLPSIAFIKLRGTTQEQIIVRPNQRRLDNLKLSIKVIEQLLKQSQYPIQSIMVKDGHKSFSLSFPSNVHTLEDLRRLAINHHGKYIQLGELASIESKTVNHEGYFIKNGTEGIELALVKKHSSSIQLLKEEVTQLLQELEKEHPSLNLSIHRDETKLLELSTENLTQSLWIGLLLACMSLLLFLRDWRALILIAASIPVAILICGFFFYLFGLSINIFSLSGMILGAGMMLDNAIIVIENITQYSQKEGTLISACVRGAQEIVRPLLSSMLTTSAVFLPILLIDGTIGALFRDQALTITVGLFCSYIVSIGLIPILYLLVFKHFVSRSSYVLPYKIDVVKWYNASTKRINKHPSVLLFTITLLFLISLVLLKYVDKEKFPYIQQNTTIISIDWNEPLAESVSLKRLQRIFEQLPEELEHLVYLSTQSYDKDLEHPPGQKGLSLYITGDKSMTAIIAHLKSELEQQYPKANIQEFKPKTIFEKLFPSREFEYELRLRGLNEPVYQEDIQKINSKLVHLLGANRFEELSPITTETQIQLQLDWKKLTQYNITPTLVIKQIQQSLGQDYIMSLRLNQLPIFIANQHDGLNDWLNSFEIKTNQGYFYPVKYFVSISEKRRLQEIQSDEQGNYIPLYFKEEGTEESKLEQFIDDIVKGSFFKVDLISRKAAYEAMMIRVGFVLLFTFLILYFILASQFESLLQPLILLIELPIDVGFAMIALYLTGTSLNMISLIGLVVMMGIVINDSILKIDTANQLQRKGYTAQEAIHIAGQRRVKPILMTSLTTIFSMLPIFFSNDMGSDLLKPMAIVIVSSLSFGTLISLFFVPRLYR